MRCQDDWFNKFGDMALNHFGRIHEPKRTGCDSAWYKSFDYQGYRNLPNRHYLVNDLLGERRLITEQQYDDDNFQSPTN